MRKNGLRKLVHGQTCNYKGEMALIAEVVINSPARGLGKIYDYKVNKDIIGTVTEGAMVTVPFGNGNRLENGFVLKLKEKSRIKGLKEIIEVIDVGFTLGEKQLELAKWISETYLCNLGVVLNLFFTDKVNARKEKKFDFKPTYDLTPTAEQQLAIDKINNTCGKDVSKKFLLHGVTGSGKTEVYIQVIKEFINKGYGAIVLVPEISLTPQTVKRFVERLGDKVAVFHSRLSKGEKYLEWQKVNNGTAKVVVGARSALFTPVKNLGIVIIDEEHDTSYKSGQSPYYNARDVAEKLCEINNATLVLGSATPDISTYYKAQIGELELIELKERTNHKTLPKIDIVDMRNELIAGNKTIFSQRLYDEIKYNLANKQQTILFLNRRGYSTFVSCRKCGFVAKCKNCNIALTYHMDKNTLECHYCGAKLKNFDVCPVCHEKYIKYFGIGTQKIENAVKAVFPEASTIRMDLDTTTQKDSHEKILGKFKDENIDILIGTQMIAKGHDFPNVTLVGVMAADTSLNSNDFYSAERTFDLLTQVAGRAGRAEKTGRVVIQTYDVDNYSIVSAKEHDYNTFYNQEILLREQLCYPPFCDILLINISGENESEVIEDSRTIREIFEEYFKDDKDVRILKEVPSPISKLKNKFRFRIIIKSGLKSNEKFNNVLEDKRLNDIKSEFTVDFNPVSFN